MLLPSALGFSPHPPVSVYGTGPCKLIAASLGGDVARFATKFRSTSHSSFPCPDFPWHPLPCLYRSFHSRLASHPRVPTFLTARGTGISTCFPSATPFGLVLGPDLPRADQLYPGNLRYSAVRILTSLSLLIPAFSLQYSPLLLIGTASSCIQCSSTNVLIHS